MDNKETPVLLLTGYLGSGKTTLLNRILRNEKGIKFAVIVNDIGEVNIDANLIEQGGIVGQSDDSLVALQNGCICCTLKADLVKQLNDIINTGKFDYIVIEASGICEPAPIAQTISTYPQLLPKNMFRNGVARLDAIVTVVDALRMRDEFGLGDDLKKRTSERTTSPHSSFSRSSSATSSCSTKPPRSPRTSSAISRPSSAPSSPRPRSWSATTAMWSSTRSSTPISSTSAR